MSRPQLLLESGLRFAGKFSADLPGFLKLELANHAIEVAGQRGESFECFDGFFGALRALARQLRNLSGGLRYLS